MSKAECLTDGHHHFISQSASFSVDGEECSGWLSGAHWHLWLNWSCSQGWFQRFLIVFDPASASELCPNSTLHTSLKSCVCLIHAADRNQNSLLLEVKWADTSPVTVTFVGICEFWKYFLAVMPHFQKIFDMMQWKTSRSNFRFLFPFLKCSCFNQQ